MSFGHFFLWYTGARLLEAALSVALGVALAAWKVRTILRVR